MKKLNLFLVFLLFQSQMPLNAASDADIINFVKAAKNGNLKVVKKLVNPDIIDSVDPSAPDGQTALIAAAENGKKEVVQFLIDHGADVNKKISNDITAIMQASANGYTDIVTILVQPKKADFNAIGKSSTDPKSFTALDLAIKNKHDDTESYLRKIGAKIFADLQDSKSFDPKDLEWIIPAAFAMIGVASLLLYLGQKGVDKFNEWSAKRAAQARDDATKGGGDGDSVIKTTKSVAASLAKEMTNPKANQTTLRDIATKSLASETGQSENTIKTQITSASQKTPAPSIYELAKENTLTVNEGLFVAIRDEKIQDAKKLIEEGATFQELNKYFYKRPDHFTSQLAKLLTAAIKEIETNVNIEKNKNTIEKIINYLSQENIAQYLSTSSIKVIAYALKDYPEAMNLAIKNKNIFLAKSLIAQGATFKGINLLAGKENVISVLKDVLDKAIESYENKSNTTDETTISRILHYAADTNLTEIFSNIFEFEKNKQYLDLINEKYDETPLMAAVRAGKKELVAKLIGYGANINKTNQKGETAYDFTHEQSMIRFLELHGGKSIGMGVYVPPATPGQQKRESIAQKARTPVLSEPQRRQSAEKGMALEKEIKSFAEQLKGKKLTTEDKDKAKELGLKLGQIEPQQQEIILEQLKLQQAELHDLIKANLVEVPEGELTGEITKPAAPEEVTTGEELVPITAE